MAASTISGSSVRIPASKFFASKAIWGRAFVCYVLDEVHIAINAFLPELVISPFASSCLHRSLLSSVQWLPFLLGESLCANRPSGSFFKVESIHPKHNASSTISMYGRVSALGVFDLLQTTQQHFSERWFFSNHSLSCNLFVNVNRFVISIASILNILNPLRQALPHAYPCFCCFSGSEHSCKCSLVNYSYGMFRRFCKVY